MDTYLEYPLLENHSPTSHLSRRSQPDAYVVSDGTNYEAQTLGLGTAVISFTGDGTVLSNSGSTGAVTATLKNAPASSVLGNASGSVGAPSYTSTPSITTLGVVEGTAPSGTANVDVCYGDSTAHALKCSYNNGTFYPATQTIGSNTVLTHGTLIGSGVSQQQTSMVITGAATTDVAQCSLNSSPPATWQTGIQMLPPVVTANAVAVWLSNPTSASITPIAATVRCTVTR